MGDTFLAVIVLLLGALLVVPFVALALVLGARKRIGELERQVDARRTELRYLYDQLTALKKSSDRKEIRPPAEAAGHPNEFRRADNRNEFRPADNRNEFRPTAEAANDRNEFRDQRNEFRPGDNRDEFRPGDNRNEFRPGYQRNEFRDQRNEFRTSDDATTAPSQPAGEFRSEQTQRNEFRQEGERKEFRSPDERNEFRSPDERNEFRSPDERNEFRREDERNEFRPGANGGKGPGDRPPRPTPPPKPKAPAIPLEQRLATYFTRIGAGALVLGALYFFKYAADNEWIGPAGRVLLGALAGVGVLAFAELTRKTTKPAYTQIIVGVGLALLYICAWASAVLYSLVSIPAAFIAETVILFLGAALAYRYRGEAILILVLIAGFANPVLLSTGVDRPLALFSYLFVLTAVAIAVSIERQFKLTIALAIAGVTVLFAGWYEKYFRVFDLRQEPWAGDRPPEELVGAYHEISTRFVPIAAAVAFTLEWLATAFVLARSQQEKHQPLKSWIKPIAVIAILLAHVAATALLYTHPLALGLIMVGLAALSVFAFRFFDTTRFLLIPMGGAFVLLAGLTADTRSEDQLILLGMLGAWAAIYLVAFLREAWKKSEGLPKTAAIQAAIGLALFTILGLILLFSSDRNLAAAGLLTATSIGFVAIGVRARATGLILIALLGTLPAMAAAGALLNEDTTYADYRFLLIGAAWSLIYAGAIVRQVVTNTETKYLSLLTLSLAGLAGLALALAGTHENVPTMRALITGAIGVADLLLAMWIHSRKRKELDGWVRILAAQALALFAPAIAFGLSGATITVAWAVLAGTAMLILAEAKDKVWLTVASLLVVATLFRVFAVDLPAVESALYNFEWSHGRQGLYSVRAFFNPRGYALAGTGLAFLGGALLVARAAGANATDAANRSKTLLIFAPIVVTIAYALLTTFAIIETRTALQSLPPAPPMPLDNEEFALFMESVRHAQAAQQNLLAMTTTVILAFVAMLLLGIGFAAKDPFHRYLGLALFLGTVGKLVLWDVWNLARIYQVVVLGVVGALLLGSGFLYARLKAFFRGETAAASILLIALTGAAQAARAQQPEAPKVPVHLYESTATLEGIQNPGDYLLHITPELYQKSTSVNLFGDLRIADEKNSEVPFVIRIAPPMRVPQIAHPRMFDPGEVAGGGFRATFELGIRSEHCQIDLELRGDSAFLRRTKIETGEKLDDFQTISQGAIVYAVDVQGARAQSSTLRYPPSIARYVRVTLLPDPDASVTKIYGAKLSCARAETLPRVERLPLNIVATKQNADAQSTELELDAGAEGVPINELILRVKTKEFVRRVQVLASSYKTAWPAVGSSLIYRVSNSANVNETSEGPESISIPISETRKRNFKVVVYNGNDAPIEVVAVEGAYAERQLIFRTAIPGAHRLYTGDKTEVSPIRSYDLAGILDRRTDELNAKPATLSPLTPNPSFGKPPQIGELPITERYRTAIGAGLAVILVLLGIWAVRLIRTKD